MAIFRTVHRLPIADGCELHVVREDTKQTIIFSINENVGRAIHHRISFEVPIKDAVKLARWIAGVTHLDEDSKTAFLLLKTAPADPDPDNSP